MMKMKTQRCPAKLSLIGFSVLREVHIPAKEHKLAFTKIYSCWPMYSVIKKVVVTETLLSFISPM